MINEIQNLSTLRGLWSCLKRSQETRIIKETRKTTPK